jgi:serine/threonine-protein kinase
MARADTELNLLFGLLALQNDLIDRHALVAAFQAWTRDRRQRALAVAEPLARENPTVVEYQERVISIHNDFGHLLLHAGRHAEAKRSFETALERAKGISTSSSTRFNYAYIYRGVGKLQRAEGQFKAALETLQEAVRIGTISPGEKPYSTYELACARAPCGAVAGEGKPEPTAEILAVRRRFADQAMEALRQAVAEGWQNLPWIKRDPDLDTLRSRDDFRRLIDDLEKAQAESH